LLKSLVRASSRPLSKKATPFLPSSRIPRRDQRDGGDHGALLAMLVLVAAASFGWFWWQQHQPRLPPGIA
jgi:hypothetical protein